MRSTQSSVQRPPELLLPCAYQLISFTAFSFVPMWWVACTMYVHAGELLSCNKETPDTNKYQNRSAKQSFIIVCAGNADICSQRPDVRPSLSRSVPHASLRPFGVNALSAWSPKGEREEFYLTRRLFHANVRGGHSISTQKLCMHRINSFLALPQYVAIAS